MAERAAHFSFTSEAKPSIFEIIAQNSLNVTLQPAFQKISEAFLGASFAEYFYGLRRISIKDSSLSKKQKHLCLLFLVVLPYIKRKLEQQLNIYQIENAEGLLSNDWKSRSKKVLLYSQSGLEITWNIWLLLNYLRYMADETESQNPVLHFLKLKLVYAGEPDNITSFWSALFRGKLSFKEFSVGLLQNGLRTSFEIGAFFIQFLQVWYKEKSSYNITALPTVPPPEPDPSAASYKGKCPICLQPWKIPTVVPVSGYIFCFSCIVKHLNEEQKCPITKYPAKAMDIVRIYDS